VNWEASIKLHTAGWAGDLLKDDPAG